jgi:DNA-directed RNA polymerase specialized sigma24 family protein
MAAHEHAGLLTDEALLHNIAHGCEDCFDLLFLRFFRPTLRLAFKILREKTEAEDIVQEVFLAIHQQRERFDPSVGTARTWVLQFAYYKSLKRRTYLWNRQFYAPHVDEDGDGCDPAERRRETACRAGPRLPESAAASNHGTVAFRRPHFARNFADGRKRIGRNQE